MSKRGSTDELSPIAPKKGQGEFSPPGARVDARAATERARQADPCPPGVTPLAVVIVTYNSAAVLPQLLSSLQFGLVDVPDCDVIVVDNASSDDSVEIAAGHPLQPRIIETGRNGGYAAGINAALATVGSESDVLLLNPDIRVSRSAISCLQHRLGPEIGVVAPRILNEDGTLSLSVRREPSLMAAWAEAILGGTLSARLDIGEVVSGTRVYNRGGAVDWTTGAILMISGRARELVPQWDESFFLYSEEVDFMRRVRQAGLKIAYVPEAIATHIGGDTRANPFLFALCATNRVVDFARHHGRAATVLFHLAALVGEGIRCWRGPEHRAAFKALRTMSRTFPAFSEQRSQQCPS